MTRSEIYEDIENERARQIEKGFDAEHDDAHVNGEIGSMGAAYAALASGILPIFCESKLWPWEEPMKAPASQLEGLTIAAALIVAEIERIHRDLGRQADARAQRP